MGIQINKRKDRAFGGRSSSKSSNLYLNFLIKIYRFLSRRTNAKINQTILRRLVMSRKNQPSVSLSRLLRYSAKNKRKVMVIVGKVLNDERILFLPKISVCALRISTVARERILKAGGQVFTFDQFAKDHPVGTNSVLVRGPKSKKLRSKISK